MTGGLDPSAPSGPLDGHEEDEDNSRDERQLDALGYTQALAELESILAELESGDVDIDVLAGRVRRAADLLELCRGRLEGAQIEVSRILAGLDDDLGVGLDPGARPGDEIDEA